MAVVQTPPHSRRVVGLDAPKFWPLLTTSRAGVSEWLSMQWLLGPDARMRSCVCASFTASMLSSLI